MASMAIWEVTRPRKLLHNYGKSPFSMGKSTISMAMFNSYVSHNQRVTPDFLHRIPQYELSHQQTDPALPTLKGSVTHTGYADVTRG